MLSGDPVNARILDSDFPGWPFMPLPYLNWAVFSLSAPTAVADVRLSNFLGWVAGAVSVLTALDVLHKGWNSPMNGGNLKTLGSRLYLSPSDSSLPLSKYGRRRYRLYRSARASRNLPTRIGIHQPIITATTALSRALSGIGRLL